MRLYSLACGGTWQTRGTAGGSAWQLRPCASRPGRLQLGGAAGRDEDYACCRRCSRCYQVCHLLSGAGGCALQGARAREGREIGGWGGGGLYAFGRTQSERANSREQVRGERTQINSYTHTHVQCMLACKHRRRMERRRRRRRKVYSNLTQ